MSNHVIAEKYMKEILHVYQYSFVEKKSAFIWNYHLCIYKCYIQIVPSRPMINKMNAHADKGFSWSHLSKGTFPGIRLLYYLLQTSHEYPQHMFLWKNYPRVIIKYSSLTIFYIQLPIILPFVEDTFCLANGHLCLMCEC